MALNQIPTLPENYPLFDWADYQSSRDALVQGTPTVQFAKSAWNALVDDLVDALAESGLEWDSTYTTENGARMTDADGQLTASKFNSVRLNIDHPAPLGWAWECKPDFRGYLGRVEMRGASANRRLCDIVYPEYIIELARKLNVLLEIMRGTGLLSDVDCGLLLGVNQEINLRSQCGARVEAGHLSASQVSHVANCGPALRTEAKQISVTLVKPDFSVRPAVHTETGTISSSQISLDAIARISIPADGDVSSRSVIQADGDPAPSLPILVEKNLRKSNVSVEAMAVPIGRVEKADSDVLIQSAFSPDIKSSASIPVSVEVSTISNTEMDIDKAFPLQASGDVLVGSSFLAEADKRPVNPICATAKSNSRMEIAATPGYPSKINSTALISTLFSCNIGTAWYPPKWVNGGLWIRQYNGATINDNGELIFGGPSGNPEITHTSNTIVSCTIDTAWYPPEYVNGGLWIKQTHNAALNEKGELIIC